MMKSLISIIIPCYNVEDFLQKTIECVIHQTYPDWELILVDDGSKDNTLKICNEYAKKDSRIKVIHKPNGGLVSARNAGFYVATGEWVMYIDGDDWIDVNTCEILTMYIEQHGNVDIIFWKCIQELGDISIKGKWEWPCKEPYHLYDTHAECIELSRNVLVYKSGIATAYCKLINMRYARENNIRHDDRLRQGAEGIEFSLRAFYHANKVLYVNEYFNHYRYNPNSISKAVNEKNTKYITDCFNVINEDILHFERKEEFKQALYQRVCYALIAMAMNSYFHPANPEPLIVKVRKYTAAIKDNPLYKEAVKYGSIDSNDKQRRLALFFIKQKWYVLLEVIAKLKQYYLKKGKYNY